MRRGAVAQVVVLLTVLAAARAADDLKAIKGTGCPGGLVVSIGCEAATSTAVLGEDKPFVVQILERDTEKIAARSHCLLSAAANLKSTTGGIS